MAIIEEFWTASSNDFFVKGLGPDDALHVAEALYLKGLPFKEIIRRRAWAFTAWESISVWGPRFPYVSLVRGIPLFVRLHALLVHEVFCVRVKWRLLHQEFSPTPALRLPGGLKPSCRNATAELPIGMEIEWNWKRKLLCYKTVWVSTFWRTSLLPWTLHKNVKSELQGTHLEDLLKLRWFA